MPEPDLAKVYLLGRQFTFEIVELKKISGFSKDDYFVVCRFDQETFDSIYSFLYAGHFRAEISLPGVDDSMDITSIQKAPMMSGKAFTILHFEKIHDYAVNPVSGKPMCQHTAVRHLEQCLAASPDLAFVPAVER